ncbi:hypothetical protein EE612_041821, partial [Oryza sativa]
GVLRLAGAAPIP